VAPRGRRGGSLTLPLLGLSVTAHRLLPDALQGVADLFEAADTEALSQAHARVQIPSTFPCIDDAAFAAAPVGVGILGPLALRTTGPMDPSRVPLAEEVVTYLAAHPGGVHPGVLAAAIWPRGVTHAVATATIERVRDWLGEDPDGSPRLRTDDSGRYLLAPSVAVDWHSLCTLLLRSRAASSTREEAELLRRALRLVRGSVLQGRPATRYTWLVRNPLERTIQMVVVDAAHRLVEITSNMSEPTDSAEAALSGLRLAPAAQLLWRDLLEAEHQRGGAAAVRAAVADMQETMDRSGARIDAETEALIEHLVATGPATVTSYDKSLTERTRAPNSGPTSSSSNSRPPGPGVARKSRRPQLLWAIVPLLAVASAFGVYKIGTQKADPRPSAR
jgi:hypothetical protein